MPEENKQKTIKKAAKPAVEPNEEEKDEIKRYYETVGRRKRAIARVRLFTCRPFEGEIGKVLINGKSYVVAMRN